MKTIKLLALLALVFITQACKKSEGLEEGILSGTYVGTQEYSRINSDGIELEDSTYDSNVEVTFSKGTYFIVGEVVDLVPKEELDDFVHDINENDGDYRVNYSFNGDQLSAKISSGQANGDTERWSFSGER